MPSFRLLLPLCLLLTIQSAFAEGTSAVTTLGPNVSVSVKRCPDIDYSLNLSDQRFFVYAPQNYTGREPFGLVVHISPQRAFTELPEDWDRVLNKHRLLFVAPQEAGNDRNTNERRGLATLGALAMMQKYRIDPNRVYASGMSGGARMAGSLGFMQSDLFSGTIQSCGTDFYHSLPSYYANSHTDTAGKPYGVVQVPSDSVQAAKAKVRFALITGSNDFRYGNIRDIYYYGFQKEGFKVKLIDVPGMQHGDCSGDAMEQAINFIEGVSR